MLPSEAQWEYACRGGTKSRFSFRDDDSDLGEYAWFTKNADDTGEKYPRQVGQKKPNQLGLFDIHGNVWEWCSDYYREKRAGGTDPQGPSFRLVPGVPGRELEQHRRALPLGGPGQGFAEVPEQRPGLPRGRSVVRHSAE